MAKEGNTCCGERKLFDRELFFIVNRICISILDTSVFLFFFSFIFVETHNECLFSTRGATCNAVKKFCRAKRNTYHCRQCGPYSSAPFRKIIAKWKLCIYRKYTRRQLKRATNVSIKPRSAVSTNRDEINAQVVMILLKQDRERQDEFEKEKNSFSLNDSIWPNHSIRLLQFQQFSQLHFHDIRKQNSILYSAGTNEIRTQKTLLRFEIKILVSGVQKVQFCEALVAHRPLFRPLKKKSSR